VVDQMMPGIRNMRDSLTYQAILEEGRLMDRMMTVSSWAELLANE
jgi:hypothetical protein